MTESTQNNFHSKRDLWKQNRIYLLPNSFTIAALFAAFYAITQSMHGRYESAAISVFFGDGFGRHGRTCCAFDQ